MGNSNKKSNYIVQGGILAAASILVRIIGMVYRIPVTRILGPIGNSYYSAAYEVYSMMLLISVMDAKVSSVLAAFSSAIADKLCTVSITELRVVSNCEVFSVIRSIASKDSSIPEITF